MDSILKDVAESEDKFVSDLQLWREYEAKEKAIKDEKSHRLTALLEGEERGRAKEKRATARKFLQLGIDCETVAAGTGLPLEEIREMAKNK